MSTIDSEDLPQLVPEVERQALQNHVHALLADLPMEEFHAAVDRLAGAGAAAAAVLERRRRARESMRWFKAQHEEDLRRDPEAVAHREDWARRLLAGEFRVHGHDLLDPDSTDQE